jgi:sugar phosphate isomerase/epimerase
MPAARDLRFPDLVWSHFSRPRLGGFDERVAAAAAAGMAGIGLYVREYERLRVDEGRSPADVRAVLDRHEVVIADVEVVRGWWATTGDVYEECQQLEALAYEMADEFGVRYLQVIGPYDCPFEQAVERFAALCDRAAGHGLLVGVEWLPFTNIASAADANAIVTAADRPNGGFCADIWHHHRGANDLALIEALDPQRVFAIQMNDGPLAPAEPEHTTGYKTDYKTDCLANRVPPGDGEFDCVGFLRTLRDNGVDAPISLEVCSTALWSQPAEVAARAAATGMRRVLARLDWSREPGPGDDADG